jgi:hypothetical protein
VHNMVDWTGGQTRSQNIQGTNAAFLPVVLDVIWRDWTLSFLHLFCLLYVVGKRDGRHGRARGSVFSTFIMAGVRF